MVASRLKICARSYFELLLTIKAHMEYYWYTGIPRNLIQLAPLPAGKFRHESCAANHKTQHTRLPRFPSNPLIIRVPFFLIVGFNKETPK